MARNTWRSSELDKIGTIDMMIDMFRKISAVCRTSPVTCATYLQRINKELQMY